MLTRSLLSLSQSVGALQIGSPDGDGVGVCNGLDTY